MEHFSRDGTLNFTFLEAGNMYNIENLFLFNGLSPDEKSEIVPQLDNVTEYKKGETIYSGSSFKNAIGVFLTGEGEATGENVLKKTFSEGDTFGAAALFGAGETYISEVRAKTFCSVLFIDEDELRKLFLKYPVIAVNYITFLSGRVRYLNEKIKLFTCKGTAAKLYRYLSDNADEDGAVKIANMSSLARLTSIGRTSLYRAMDELIEGGFIERQNLTIRVR
jgi:CRP-like cAMP-binding protein